MSSLLSYFKKLTTPIQAIHDYWKSPPDLGNHFEAYSKCIDRSKFLVELVKPYLNSNDQILELGSNCGRNLSYLFKAGYFKLSAIDINNDALIEMERRYPELKDVKKWCGALETALPGYSTLGFDCVFSMAVLQHIHPESEQKVFFHVARITRRHLITIEDESDRQSWRHFQRNYKQVFRKHNMLQIHAEDCSHVGSLGRSFIARVFLKNE